MDWKPSFTIFFDIYFETGPTQDECKTVSGPSANKPCMFPFRYNGVSTNFGQFWKNRDAEKS